MIDVVIVGAGPAGSIAGQKIAKAGFEVVILEKNDFPGSNKICGGAVSEECFKNLQLPDNIIEKKSSQVIVHLSEEKLRAPDKASFVLFNREIFDMLLAQKAVNDGAKLLTSTRATDVSRKGPGITIIYKKSSKGRSERISAQLVVFADGTATLARRKLGLGFEGKPNCTAYAAAYDCKWLENPKETLDFFFKDNISPFGYGWVFPKRDSVNIGVLCLQSLMKESIWMYLNRFIYSEKLDTLKIMKSGFRLMPQSVVDKIYGERVLVIGDAAGTADPIDGGGICNAAASGKVAAEIAIKALETENPTADFLANYENHWKKTDNYKRFLRSFDYQQLALLSGTNLGTFLKKIGLFNQYKLLK